LWRLPLLNEQFVDFRPDIDICWHSCPTTVPPGVVDLSIPRVHRHCQTVAEECAGVIFVAVDIGGTFTDLIGFDDRAGRFIQAKSLTTPANLVQGIIDCIDKSDVDAAAIDELIHGSTIAINTLIERKGAKTGLVVPAARATSISSAVATARCPTICSSTGIGRCCRGSSPARRRR
jgi:hypothetical protein